MHAVLDGDRARAGGERQGRHGEQGDQRRKADPARDAAFGLGFGPGFALGFEDGGFHGAFPLTLYSRFVFCGSTYRSSLTVLLRERGVLMIDLGETVTPGPVHRFDIANDIKSHIAIA
jgi:hypothetical protein